jgi:hypothetical protein
MADAASMSSSKQLMADYSHSSFSQVEAVYDLQQWVALAGKLLPDEAFCKQPDGL